MSPHCSHNDNRNKIVIQNLFFILSRKNAIFIYSIYQLLSLLVGFDSVCLNGMESQRKRSTTIEYDPIVLAHAAKGKVTPIFSLP